MTGLIRPSRGRLRVLGMQPLGSRALLPAGRLLHPVRLLPARRDRPRLHPRLAAPARPGRAARRTSCTERGAGAGGHDRGRRPQAGRLQQGDAPAHPPGPGPRPPPAGAGARRAAERPRPHGPRRDHVASSRALADEGLHVVISSHILHEVDRISDQVVLLSHGYVVAEGQIHGVRDEVTDQPMQILVRCADPQRLARLALRRAEHVVEAKVQPDGKGLLVRTRDADRFHRLLNRTVARGRARAGGGGARRRRRRRRLPVPASARDSGGTP